MAEVAVDFMCFSSSVIAALTSGGTQLSVVNKMGFVETAKTQELSDNSWLVDIADINKDTWDLDVNNPNRVEEVDSRTPQEIIAEIEELDAQAAKALQAIKELL